MFCSTTEGRKPAGAYGSRTSRRPDWEGHSAPFRKVLHPPRAAFVNPARHRQGALTAHTRNRQTAAQLNYRFFCPSPFDPSIASELASESFLHDLAAPALDSTCLHLLEGSSTLIFLFAFFCCLSAVVHFSVRCLPLTL